MNVANQMKREAEEICSANRKYYVETIEYLARHLHEAGRAAVLQNKVHKTDGAPIGKIIFKEWDEISEDAKEGRRIQARYLMNQFTIYPKMF